MLFVFCCCVCATPEKVQKKIDRIKINVEKKNHNQQIEPFLFFYEFVFYSVFFHIVFFLKHVLSLSLSLRVCVKACRFRFVFIYRYRTNDTFFKKCLSP